MTDRDGLLRRRLRTSASTSATRRRRLAEGARVTSVGAVSGGVWSARCTGSIASGSGWYRVTSVSGKSVKALYGVTYVYAAKGLFAPGHRTPSPAPTPDPDARPRRRPRAHRQRRADASAHADASDPTPTPAPTPTPTPTPTPSPRRYIEGIDVSHWQGDDRLGRRSRRRQAASRSSRRPRTPTTSDPTYATNRAQARGRRACSSAPTTSPAQTATAGDAVAEADHFVDTAAPRQGRPAPGARPRGHRAASVRRALQAWVQAFLDRVYERTGVQGRDLRLAELLVAPTWATRQSFAKAGYTMLWIAHWTTGAAPTVPGEQLGRPRLDVLAVHVGAARSPGIAGPRRPRPLPAHGLRPGPRPVARERPAGERGRPADPLDCSRTWTRADAQRPATTGHGPRPTGPQRARRADPRVGHRRRRGRRGPVRHPPRDLRRLHRLGPQPLVHRGLHPRGGAAAVREHPHRVVRHGPPDHALPRGGAAAHPRGRAAATRTGTP